MTEDLKRVYGALPELVEQMQAGVVDRREFLRTATLLGLSATAAYALAGMEIRPASRPSGRRWMAARWRTHARSRPWRTRRPSAG